MKLQAQISAILKWADPFIEVEEEDRNCLAHLSEGGAADRGKAPFLSEI